MTVEKIIPCVCCDHQPTDADSVYYGMPILRVCGHYIAHKQFWEVQCPNCGRGGTIQHNSAYLALKHWNELMERCYRMEGKERRNYGEHHLQAEGRGGGVRRLCREHLHRMPPPLLLLFRAPGPPPGPGSVSLLM